MAKKKGPKAGRAKQKQKAQRAGDGGASSWASSMQQHGRMIHSDDEDGMTVSAHEYSVADRHKTTMRHVQCSEASMATPLVMSPPSILL